CASILVAGSPRVTRTSTASSCRCCPRQIKTRQTSKPMTTFSDFDRHAMARALELAARGSATTQPNPRVGCVIAKDGRIIGEGWHEQAGGPHAEVAALRSVQSSPGGLANARDATVYVNLEPCSHHGRTPPCSDALVSARVARVVFSIPDPN